MAFLLLAAGAVHAEPLPRGPLRLVVAPCEDESGAALRCASPIRKVPRTVSYFEAHERLVMRDMVSFNHSYTLEYLRDRDLLRLYGPTPGSTAGVSYGVAMFSTAVLAAAHMPPGPARVIFDHTVHFGPALFEGGGMGAGIGARM